MILVSKQGHKEIVKLLLQNGADVNIKDDKQGSPLHYASLKGHSEIAKLLLLYGADVECQLSNKVTPLILASEKGLGELEHCP